MNLRTASAACAAVLATMTGLSAAPRMASADAVPEAISQSSAYAHVLASVKGNLCDLLGSGTAEKSMTVTGAGTVDGTTVFVISSKIGGKCGQGEIAAVVADGHGRYRTVLMTRGEDIAIYPGGSASVGRSFVGDPASG